jgi:hypothetical protein
MRVYFVLAGTRQKRRELARLLGIREHYLVRAGYFNPTPADAQGAAVPWFTYPAIEFLKSVVDRERKVFEYGCGYSTIFFNGRCQKTVSVEHSAAWFKKLKDTSPDFEIYLAGEGSFWTTLTGGSTTICSSI